jgi:hypothetical protein
MPIENRYFHDVTLREKLRTFLEDKLNENSVNDVEFILGKDFYQIDDEPVQIVTVDGSYKTIEKSFTPGMIMEFIGTPEAIKDTFVISYTIPIMFLVETQNKYTSIKESLQAFTLSLVGEDFEIGDYLIGTNCSEVTNSEQVQDINGIEYVKMSTNVFISVVKDALLGNKIETYLGLLSDYSDLVRIYPIERNITRVFIEENTQYNDKKETFTAFKESTYSGTLSFVININKQIFIELIDHMEEPKLLNKLFSHRIKYGFLNPYNKLININSITLDGTIGTYSIMTIVFKRHFKMDIET